MKVAPRREFGMATPILHELQNDIEAQMKDTIGRDSRFVSKAEPTPIQNGGCDAKSLSRLCHFMDCRRDELHMGQSQAATPAASRHASNASARKSRCVRAETR